MVLLQYRVHKTIVGTCGKVRKSKIVNMGLSHLGLDQSGSEPQNYHLQIFKSLHQ